MDLSIIIPVYNGEKYLKRCVISVIEQQYKDFEIIIINDGSLDKTKKICDELELSDDRIKCIHNSNQGVSISRNIGIKNSKGEFITFIDADDYIKDGIYIDLLATIKEKNLDMIFCSYTMNYGNYEEDDVFSWDDKLLLGKEIVKNISCNMLSNIDINGEYSKVIMGSVCRSIFKRNIIENNKLSFNEKLRFSEDLVFILEYLNFCNRVYTTNKCYYVYNKQAEFGVSATQKYLPNLEVNLKLVDSKILTILNFLDLEDSDLWRLRKLTNIYTCAINISKFENNEGVMEKNRKLKRSEERRVGKECRL